MDRSETVIELYGDGTAKAFFNDTFAIPPEIEGYEPFFVNTVLGRRPFQKIVSYRRVMED